MSAINLERNLKIFRDFQAQEKKDKAALARIYNLSRERIFAIVSNGQKWEKMMKKAEKAKQKES